MSNYRRAIFPGGYYFFTAITYRRRKLFAESKTREYLCNAWQKVQQQYPFELTAVCLLPEHIHCVWRLPDGDNDFSMRWRLIKRYFTLSYLADQGRELAQSRSRIQKGERGVWQRRFWEHQIRDETDLQNHVDYIHYNPLKHNMVERVEDWPWSSYHRFVKEGFYKHRILKEVDGDYGENLSD